MQLFLFGRAHGGGTTLLRTYSGRPSSHTGGNSVSDKARVAPPTRRFTVCKNGFMVQGPIVMSRLMKPRDSEGFEKERHGVICENNIQGDKRNACGADGFYSPWWWGHECSSATIFFCVQACGQYALKEKPWSNHSV
uniref:Uncharacterized protein n=1 Tax=Eutreptiella gymnastica TaxID=73025 RepID=A0A7S1IRI1_9EUGL